MWFAVYLLGWLWWTVAAGMNARVLSIRATSPWRALAGWCLAGVSTVALLEVPELPVFVTVPLVMLIVIGLGLGSIGAILGMRTSAAAIGAPTDVWSRVIWLPFLIGMVASVLGRISAGSDNSAPPAFRIGVGVVQFAGVPLWIFTLYRAMATFDERCVAQPAQNPVEQLPVFMRHGRMGSTLRPQTGQVLTVSCR